MKTILAIAILALAACGGTQTDSTESASNQTAPAVDLTGNYTFTMFASFIGVDPAHPPPETVMLTGPMALTQSGAKVSGFAVLKRPEDGGSPFGYTETRIWSGTVAVENGINVVRLDDPNSNHMVAVVDASGNLTGPAGENHAACTRGMGWGCEAIRQR